MNEKLFIPGKSKIGKWSKKTAVIAYRHGISTADEVIRKYGITLNELRKLNRKYYLEVSNQNSEAMAKTTKKNDKERIAELESQLKEVRQLYMQNPPNLLNTRKNLHFLRFTWQ